MTVERPTGSISGRSSGRCGMRWRRATRGRRSAPRQCTSGWPTSPPGRWRSATPRAGAGALGARRAAIRRAPSRRRRGGPRWCPPRPVGRAAGSDRHGDVPPRRRGRSRRRAGRPRGGSRSRRGCRRRRGCGPPARRGGCSHRRGAPRPRVERCGGGAARGRGPRLAGRRPRGVSRPSGPRAALPVRRPAGCRRPCLRRGGRRAPLNGRHAGGRPGTGRRAARRRHRRRPARGADVGGVALRRGPPAPVTVALRRRRRPAAEPLQRCRAGAGDPRRRHRGDRARGGGRRAP